MERDLREKEPGSLVHTLLSWKLGDWEGSALSSHFLLS